MNTLPAHQPASFANEGGRIGIQAGQYNSYGNTVIQHAHDPLRLLPRAAEAPFNSIGKQLESTCLNGTRVDFLNEIYKWVDGRDNRYIFWLNGLAGTGKSTIARTVARRYYEQKRLAASFFFSKGGGEVGHAGLFVTSIAVQLAQNVPASRQHIRDAVAEHSDIASQSLRDQWHHLVLRPLSKLRELPSQTVIIDALDECNDDNDIRLIVQLLAEARSLESVRLRVFLTSRPEVPIRHGFDQLQDAEHQDFVLHNMSPSIVDHDIKLFLEHTLGLIGQEDGQGAGWPGAEVIQTLVRSASGLFIWAATACRFIHEGLFGEERLRMLAEGSDFSNTTNPEEHLSSIYITVLQSSTRSTYSAGELKKYHTIMRQILGSIAALSSPLSIGSLSNLLLLPKQRLDRMLKDLHAILNISRAQGEPLRLHHPSFRDFLFNKNRCSDANFWVDEKQAHAALADNCIQLMSSSLKQNICGLGAPGTLVANVQKDRLEQRLPPELKYACLYWVQHLDQSRHHINDGDSTVIFLQEHFLHWLEAMSLVGETNKCTHLIETLYALVNPSNNALSLFLQDARRFTLRFCYILEEAPLQIYSSALIFAPEASTIRKAFVDEIPGWVQMLSKRESDWDACRSVLEGHTSSVSAVAFSPDGQLVASASWDKTVRVWEAATGSCRSVLEGHTASVSAVAFSPDGQLVASASGDKTVRVWEAATGSCRSVLEGHTASVSAVAFSPDGQYLRTDRGDIPLLSTSTPSPSSQRERSSNVFIQGQWISLDQRLLWLPPEYRPTCSAVNKDIICLGHSSGRTTLLKVTMI